MILLEDAGHEHDLTIGRERKGRLLVHGIDGIP